MTLTYTLTRWSLSDLFPAAESPEMKAAFTQLEADVAVFEGRRAQLKPDISTADFMAIARQYEQLSRLGYRIQGFAELSFNADTQDQASLAFLMNVEQTMATLQNRTLFFNLWWKDLDEDSAARLMADSGDYRYWLEEMRHFKPHTLSEPEEKIVNIKNVTGASALRNLYDSITNRYVFKLEVDGEVKELTRDGLMMYVQGPNQDLRAAAYQELYRVYSGDGPILGQMYQTMVNDWKNEQVDLRHFSTPIAARNLNNDIPDQVVSTLLEVCERNAALFQRYFRLKARWLGMDRLRRYDIYAPVAQADKRYDFDLATKMVLESFFTTISEMVQVAVDHVDSEVRNENRAALCDHFTDMPPGCCQFSKPRRATCCPRWATPSTPCWRLSTACSPSTPPCPWQRPPPPLARCCSSTACLRRRAMKMYAVTSSSAKWTMPTLPSSARRSSPSSSARRTRWSARAPRWTSWLVPISRT
jgi:oligoendopeptidase F